MSNTCANSAERFSNRVENYVRYRPTYPDAVLDLLKQEIGLAPHWTIADVGAGTGISTEMFLRHGNTVYAVEPNGPMRAAAERLLAGYPNFHSVAGTAEATTLAGQSVDCVVAAQAFHWFDRPRAGQEFLRVLRPDGWVVLLWNSRRLDSTPFLRAYEALLQQFGTDYRHTQHQNTGAPQLDEFFGHRQWRKRVVDNEQRLPLDGLRGRLLSSSYVPAEGQPGYELMLQLLESIFAAHQRRGEVCIEYDAEIYYGRLSAKEKTPAER